jgi:hypothetical protein
MGGVSEVAVDADGPIGEDQTIVPRSSVWSSDLEALDL